MKIEDFDKILKNMEHFDVDEKGNVTTKPNINAEITPERARVVRLSYAIYNSCSQKLFGSKDKTIEYARTMYKQMLPFFNDFETLIKDSARHSNGISANDISSLLAKHEEDCKHFYSIVENVLLTPARIRPFVEHALNKDVPKIDMRFHEEKDKGPFQNRIEQTDILFK